MGCPGARRGVIAAPRLGARRYGPGMGLLVYLIVLAFSGLIVGALARLALPGPTR